MSTRHRPARVTRLLVWGGWYGSRNIGDSAILLGIKRLVRDANSRWDHYYVAALSTDIDYTATHGVSGVRALLKSDIFKPGRWFSLAREFQRAELVVVSGGTPLFDFSHAVRTVYLALPILLRRRFVFFGIGVKPITSWYGRLYIPAALKRADYVSVRDSGSLKILQRLGVQNAVLTADSAFFAEPSSAEELEALLRRHGIASHERILLVAPRHMSDERKVLYLDREVGADLVRTATDALTRAIDELAGDFDRVVLAAMHYHGRDSDMPLCNSLMQGVSATNVVAIDEELRPEVMISLLAKADVVLAMRLHAALLAASMCTPVVAVAYEQKVTDLMDHLELSGYCADLFALDSEDVVGLVRDASAHSNTIEADLRERTQLLKNLVLEDARSVLRLDDEA